MSEHPNEQPFDFVDAERQLIYAELDHFTAIAEAVRQRVGEEPSPEEIREALLALMDEESLRDDFESLAASKQSRELDLGEDIRGA